MNSEIRARFDRNIARVRALVAVFEKTNLPRRGRRTTESTDILRAAVVLLHAAVEDVLRSLERRTLPKADADLLEDIPLAGQQRLGKFTLGNLAAFRGRTVNDVLDLSVEAYLQRMTYNSPGELAEGLERLGVEPAKVNSHFASLEELMKRRHHIVHRADRDEKKGSGHHPTRSLSKSQVIEWANVAEAFIGAVFREIPDLAGPAP